MHVHVTTATARNRVRITRDVLRAANATANVQRTLVDRCRELMRFGRYHVTFRHGRRRISCVWIASHALTRLAGITRSRSHVAPVARLPPISYANSTPPSPPRSAGVGSALVRVVRCSPLPSTLSFGSTNFVHSKTVEVRVCGRSKSKKNIPIPPLPAEAP